jgi:hypothetical protein
VTENPDLPAWAYRVAFARHFGEAREALAGLTPPDPGNRHDVLAYMQGHALLAIAAALDPDTAAVVMSLETDGRRETTTPMPH